MRDKQIESAIDKIVEGDVESLFAKALDEIPDQVVGSYDPQSHTKIDDLMWISLHELDMYDEGEESDIKNAWDRKKVVKYMKKWQAYAPSLLHIAFDSK